MTDTSESAATVTRVARVTLRPVTPENLDSILKLKVAPAQENFVANNAKSLAQGAYNRYAWRRAIYAGETPVGFVMLYDNPDEAEYFLWRLMIDQRYQRFGFGRQALEQVIDYVCGRPGAQELLTSYVPGEGCPQPFYAALGFVETGEVDEGETVMRLALAERAQATVPAPRPLTHVVLFKLKEPTPEIIDRAVNLLRGLEGKIPELRGIEVGIDTLHTQRSYDIALITRFDDLAGMQAYQTHPEHVAVLEYLRSVLAASVAVDFVQD